MSEYINMFRRECGSGTRALSPEFIEELMLLMKVCVESGGNSVRFKLPKFDKEEPPYCEITFTYDK